METEPTGETKDGEKASAPDIVDATTMTLEEIRIAGLRALSRDLGAVGLIRFLQQFETGSGDYTTERYRWLDKYTVSDAVQELKEWRESKRAGWTD